MPGTGEIKARIQSIQEIQKVTNAMKVVSASKLKRAKAQHNKTASFFYDIETVLVDILGHSAEVRSSYFNQHLAEERKEGKRNVAILVLTGDKGLSGGYDINVKKQVEKLLAELGDDVNTEILVAGRMGREHLKKLGPKINEDFVYPVQNPTVYRAREIGEFIRKKFDEKEYDDVYVVYTLMKSSLLQEPTTLKLLPLDVNELKASLGITDTDPQDDMMKYEPSTDEVFDVVIKKYLNWVIYTCFVEAFTSEQSARMNAMETASDNAEEMLDKLNLSYNRARQAAITQEITEIVGGAASV